VNFWVTSGIVPLLVREADTAAREVQLKNATGVIV